MLSSKLYQRVRLCLDSILGFSDRLLNRLFTSDYNPFYRSGTLAVAFLIIATVTGVLLLFVYRVGTPYESVAFLQEHPLLIGWLRSMHRYSSDLMLIAVVLHALRMFVQRKSWGARILAWTSGALLLGLLFITGWTGFVMVWGFEGQMLAQAFTRMIDATALLSTPISQAFSGTEAEPPGAFFFLLLFVHGVLPLALLFGLWVHTSRMARASWFPPMKVSYALVGILLVVSLLIPASLDEKANLFVSPEEFTLNFFYNPWLPFTRSMPLLTIVSLGAGFSFLLLLPWFLSPLKEERPPKSDLDQLQCNGCVQCVLDCPYEAISMVPRTEGSLKLSEMVAEVEAELCVSCGLCSASCARMTIGPPARKGSDQYLAVKSLVQRYETEGEELNSQTIVIACTNQIRSSERLRNLLYHRLDVQIYPVACMGSLHMVTIGHLAYYFQNLILAACPERNCTNKDAYMLLRDRLTGQRLPGLPGRVDRSRGHLIAAGEGEEDRVLNVIDGLSSCSETDENHSGAQTNKQTKIFDQLYTHSWKQRFVTALSALLACAFLAVPSSWSYTRNIEQGLLRFSWRTSNQVIEQCRELTAEERAERPVHMQAGTVCDRQYLPYRLLISLNGSEVYERVFTPSGLRGDNPLYVFGELPLKPGEYLLNADFSPVISKTEQEEAEGALRLSTERRFTLSAGEVVLLSTEADQSSLVLLRDEDLHER